MRHKPRSWRAWRIRSSAALAVFLFLSGAPDGSAQTVPGGLTVTTRADRDRVYPEGHVRFWISIRNSSGAEVRAVHLLSFEGPDLSATGPCWKKGVPACTLLGDGRRVPQASADLRPGETVTFTADMLPDGDAAGKVSLTGVLGWELEGRQQSSFVTAGPVELVDRWGALRWLYEILKDLGLPLVLLFMGWYFRVSELRRSQVQQTWSQMLQKSHENAEKYYMPLSSALLRIRVDAAKPSTPASEEEILGDILMILRRQHEMALRIGGWYFKDRDGEEAMAATWRAFYLTAEKWFGREDIEHLLERLGCGDKVAQIQDKLRREPSLIGIQSRLKSCFRNWRSGQDFAVSLDLLAILEILLDFEMNRPYEVWYGQKELFNLGSFREPLERLQAFQRQLTPQDTFKERLEKLCGMLEQYRRKARLHNVWVRLSQRK